MDLAARVGAFDGLLDDDVYAVHPGKPVVEIPDRQETQTVRQVFEVLNAAALAERQQVAFEAVSIDAVLQLPPKQLVVEPIRLIELRAIDRVQPPQELGRLVVTPFDGFDTVIAPLVVVATIAQR